MVEDKRPIQAGKNDLTEGVAMGAAVIIAKEYGAKNYKTMRLAIHTDVAFGLTAGVTQTILDVETVLEFLVKVVDGKCEG